MKNFAYIDLICTKDGDTWCSIETAAIDALPTDTAAEQLVKNQRTCSTLCTQKVLVKIIAANRLYDQTAAQVILERVYYNLLNGLCAKNAAGDYCVTVAQRFDSLGNLSLAAGCLPLPISPQCPTTCKAFATSWLATQGCCYQSLADSIVDPLTGVSVLAGISTFVTNTCAVTIPDACARVTGSLTAKLVIYNLAAVWYAANVAAIRAAILLDIAAQIGCRTEDIDATFTTSTVTTAGEFSTQSSGAVTVTFGVSADTQAEATSQADALSTSLSSQTFGLSSTAALTSTTYASKDDPSQPVAVAYSSSSVTTSDSSAASTRASSMVAGAVAVLAAALLL